MGDLLPGDVEQGVLCGRRTTTADHPAPGNVVVEAHGSDQVGVEREELSRPQDAVGGFLKPRVGAWTGGQQAGFRILAPAGQALADEVAEGFGLLHPRDRELVQGTNRLFAGGERHPERLDFLCRLDGPRVLQDRLSVGHAQAELLQRSDHQGVGPIGGQDVRATPVLPQRLVDLRRPAPRHRFGVARDQHVVEGNRRPDVAHGLQPGAQVASGRKVEQHRRAMREGQGVADDVVHGPYLHVPAAGGVTKVDRVHHQHRLVVPAAKLLSDAVRAECANGPLVDGIDGVVAVHRPVFRSRSIRLVEWRLMVLRGACAARRRHRHRVPAHAPPAACGIHS